MTQPEQSLGALPPAGIEVGMTADEVEQRLSQNADSERDLELRLEPLRKQYNACVANGLLLRARHIARQMAAIEASHNGRSES